MGFTSSRYGCTIGAENKSVKFFFKFFFRWVWVLGCGCSGVGARVGIGAGWIERAEDGAGWIGIDAVGWVKRASLASPICRSG